MDIPSQQEVVETCAKFERELAGVSNSPRIVRIRDFAVKFGRISDEEVSNQRRAYDLLDPTIVKVPRIFSYFSSAGTRYMVMEFIHAIIPTRNWDETSIDNIVRAILHLHSFECDRPGPTNGGFCKGTLWPDDDRVSFSTHEHLEAYVESRLTDMRGKFGNTSPLVFVHGDLALRNILLSTDGAVWLVDWEFAGYFPRSAEVAILRQGHCQNMDDLHFRQSLADTLSRRENHSEEEERQVEAWLEFSFNSIRFAW